MTKRRVYSVQELLRLRPSLPPPDVLRTAPLPIPRRPSPSPSRSPPSGRLRNVSISASPPSSQHILSSPVDGSFRNASPLLPPGFGPPRSIGIAASPPTQTLAGIGSTLLNISTSSQPSTKVSRGAQRIARGPNPAANFATRIAFAARKKDIPTSTTAPSQHKISRRDIAIESEIDRLFANEQTSSSQSARFKIAATPASTSTPVTVNSATTINTNTSPVPIPSIIPRSHESAPSAPLQEQVQQNYSSSLEDAAATLASVAYPLSNTTPSKTPSNVAAAQAVPDISSEETPNNDESNQDQLNMTFDDFAKQLAAVAARNVIEDEDDVIDDEKSDIPIVDEPLKLEVDSTAHDDNQQQSIWPKETNLQDANQTKEGIIDENEATVPQPAIEDKQNNHASGRNNNEASDDVAALAKWFSSLAATNDEIVTEVKSDKEQGIEESVQPQINEIVEENGNIDSGIVSFFDSILRRTVDGEMMEWASGLPEENVEINFELDDLIEPQFNIVEVPTQSTLNQIPI